MQAKTCKLPLTHASGQLPLTQASKDMQIASDSCKQYAHEKQNHQIIFAEIIRNLHEALISFYV